MKKSARELLKDKKRYLPPQMSPQKFLYRYVNLTFINAVVKSINVGQEESKPKIHMAFEPAVPLLGLYILMHVPKDGHIEVFSDVLFVKTKG